MSNVSVQVIPDNVVEGDEEFDLTLTLPSSVGRGITLGSRNTSIGVIMDSTSKYLC